MRTLHTGWTYKHENGSIVQIVAPVYARINGKPVGYRLKKVDGIKEFYYSAIEMQDLIISEKLKRIH